MTRVIKRREFLKSAAILGAAGVTAACDSKPEGNSVASGPVAPGSERVLKMVTAWPRAFPGLGTSAERLAERITSATGGRLKIELFAAGELVSAFQAFDAVSNGTADMAHHADDYQRGKSKAFAFFTSVPYGMTADEFAAWIYFDGGQALWDELYARFNAKPLLACTTGAQLGGWYRREINSVADFKGLKIRVPGIASDVVRALGASVAAIPRNEVVTALEHGTIDAAEWAGPWDDLALGMQRSAKYYYYPGFHMAAAAMSLAVNIDVWNSLGPTDQRILEEVCGREYLYSGAEYKVRNAEAQKILKDQHGVVARRLPADVLAAAAAASTTVLRDLATADAFTKRVADSYRAAMEKYIAYEEAADFAYIAARRRGMAENPDMAEKTAPPRDGAVFSPQ